MNDNAARELAAAFCRRHGVRAIALSLMSGVTDAEQVCNVVIDFLQEDQCADFRVQFKLQAEQAQIGTVVSGIGEGGELQFGQAQPEPQTVAAILSRFFAAIESRVAKVRHEQSVQSITFLGNSFRLKGKTVFTVVGDVDGRLDIELHKGEQRQAAVLLASSLLDGLYDGSIELLVPSPVPAQATV